VLPSNLIFDLLFGLCREEFASLRSPRADGGGIRLTTLLRGAGFLTTTIAERHSTTLNTIA